eukprot:CAMPEP_0168317940 /NCGR_PEP_ID=MMETSP0213-20121227/181_1 /TAXON_ID=151035 /ORGANISM="Euplotes harpa, Strain FSP1.4" /LENGTH=69 /DNA_ID=CAMNT_0008318909 /DNA_START=692 /DNA_END=901 /DNA_ORIENTATION=+
MLEQSAAANLRLQQRLFAARDKDRKEESKEAERVFAVSDEPFVIKPGKAFKRFKRPLRLLFKVKPRVKE